ncbi:hypothetical protein [Yersinia kristensenii]|uniref:hypothetical protein n=1 Tax=Yersinia kristensenii TaxID=28152 RepID=UPI0022FF3D5F|nr:hypothetical protein [Yersinia kristensenii]MDA5490882.1 hypothetical protein [Yersinia kristensenii]
MNASVRQYSLRQASGSYAATLWHQVHQFSGPLCCKKAVKDGKNSQSSEGEYLGVSLF